MNLNVCPCDRFFGGDKNGRIPAGRGAETKWVAHEGCAVSAQNAPQVLARVQRIWSGESEKRENSTRFVDFCNIPGRGQEMEGKLQRNRRFLGLLILFRRRTWEEISLLLVQCSS